MLRLFVRVLQVVFLIGSLSFAIWSYKAHKVTRRSCPESCECLCIKEVESYAGPSYDSKAKGKRTFWPQGDAKTER